MAWTLIPFNLTVPAMTETAWLPSPTIATSPSPSRLISTLDSIRRVSVYVPGDTMMEGFEASAAALIAAESVRKIPRERVKRPTFG